MSFCATFHAIKCYDKKVECAFDIFGKFSYFLIEPKPGFNLTEDFKPFPSSARSMRSSYENISRDGPKLIACFDEFSASLLDYSGIPHINIIKVLGKNLDSFGEVHHVLDFIIYVQ
uniref:Uncharacterized protein n=1 Tax=Tetranychus urticae TaxID=32264 RepID=T1KWR8_TETUR